MCRAWAHFHSPTWFATANQLGLSKFLIVHIVIVYSLVECKGVKECFEAQSTLRQTFVVFQESHSITSDASFWRSQWGNDLWFYNGSEHSAGVIILKLYEINFMVAFCTQIVTILVTFFVLLSVTTTLSILLSTFMGTTQHLKKKQLFDSIGKCILHWLGKFPNALLLIGEDFNVDPISSGGYSK